MSSTRRHRYLRLSVAKQAALINGARDAEPVKGLTHGYYKYPARFSPQFVRSAIETFTRRGQLVLDPHVGGGTTLVEARALGRHSIGVDISQLAEFVATVKTTVYSEAELDDLARWSKRVAGWIDIHGDSLSFDDYVERG
ncbi:MAG: site-specific DNA-methyltransferase [Xanthobacteraceae bacterium]|nr:site-specific DNA-methyltransferase [Xanthobacteraceae bacterium]